MGGLSKSLGQYADIKPILDAALKSNGGRYRLATHAQAVRWRARAYYYRKLLQQQKDFLTNAEKPTPYDAMKINIAPKGSPDDNVCVLDFYRPLGQWEPNEGETADPIEQATLDHEDELALAAKRFAKDLLGE